MPSRSPTETSIQGRFFIPTVEQAKAECPQSRHSLTFSAHLASDALPNTRMAKATSTPPLYWIVRNSDIHHRGVFARCDIPKDALVIEYLGEKITKAESERRAQALLKKSKETGCAAVYIFNLNKKQDLDGSMAFNKARLINHSCEPNCEAVQSRGRIWITALQDIPKGTELTFNYGFDLENWSEHPCLCGSENCVGFIAGKEYWPALRRLKKKFTPKPKTEPEVHLVEKPASKKTRTRSPKTAEKPKHPTRSKGKRKAA